MMNGTGGDAYNNLCDMNALANRNNRKPLEVRKRVVKKTKQLPLV